MLNERDPFEFVLAESLGMTLVGLRQSMTPGEYSEWRGFWTWRNAMEDFEMRKAQARRGR